MTTTNKSSRRIAEETIEALTYEERRAIIRAGEVEAVARIAALPERIRFAMTSLLCLN